jgi:hypothetical protein
MMTAVYVAVVLGSILVALGGPKGEPGTPERRNRGLTALGVVLILLSWPLFLWVLAGLKPE